MSSGALYSKPMTAHHFPRQSWAGRTLLTTDMSCIPLFKEPDYAVLDHPFEKWLLENVQHKPTGNPEFPVVSEMYPESFGHFHRVFSSFKIRHLAFLSPSQCYDVDFQGQTYCAFASDAAGDLFSVLPGQDNVYHLRHDPQEVRDCGMTFEAFVKTKERGSKQKDT